jgi:dihydrofolate reductase
MNLEWVNARQGTCATNGGTIAAMRKVVLYELLSLDGVAEDPDGFIPAWDEEMQANLVSVISRQDAVLLGRHSYDEWAEFWPDSVIQPFADFINGVTKYVFTSTMPERDWANTSIVEKDPVEFVRGLKAGKGGDIGIHASISLAQTLLGADLVDELSLVIAPTIAGTRRRLLDEVGVIRLEPIQASTSPTGHLLLSYRVVH